MMSIGAGTGIVEDKIIRHFGMRVISILAIEPNPVHFENLRQMSDKWNDTILELDSSFFDENYDTAKRFDVILINQSIYGIKNPIESILKAKSLLKHGGKFPQTIKRSFRTKTFHHPSIITSFHVIIASCCFVCHADHWLVQLHYSFSEIWREHLGEFELSNKKPS